MFLPFGNQTYSEASGWRAEPNFRGSYTILTACVSTLILCVWTALHLNIPENGPAKKQWLRKTVSVLLGMFAPELIVWTAYSNWMAARKLNRAMEGKFGWKWSLVHSHYIVMGGIAVETDTVDFVPQGYPRLSLTPSGVELLADLEPDIFPEINLEDIKDKSKASSFLKAFVCLQAAWFCVQCFIRLSQGLAISLLELSTFVHTLCALLAYCFWWDKPLDIAQPTVIPLDGRASELFALLTLASRFGGELGFKHDRPCAAHRPFLFGNVVELQLKYSMGANSSLKAAQPDRFEVDGDDEVHGFKLTNVRDSLKNGAVCSYRLSRSDILRLELAAAAIQKYRPNPALKSHFRTDDGRYTIPCGPDKLTVRMHNHPSDWRLVVVGTAFLSRSWWRLKPISVSLSLAGFIYGGAHLLAWNAPFQTKTEMRLWHASSTALTATGPIIYIFTIIARLMRWLYRPEFGEGLWPERVPDRVRRIGFYSAYWLAYFIVYCYCLAYVFLRLFLVVECFVNIRHLPDLVFVLPSWSGILPHIS